MSDIVDTLFVPAKRPARADALDQSEKSDATRPQGAAAEPVKFEEIIWKVQQSLIKLGHLSPQKSDGTPADDGLLTDETRDAINRFFTAENITAEERLATFGEESDPDYWPKLLHQLEAAAK